MASEDETLTVVYDLAAWKIPPFKHLSYQIDTSSITLALICYPFKYCDSLTYGYRETLQVPKLKIYSDNFRKAVISKSAIIHVQMMNHHLVDTLEVKDVDDMTWDVFQHWMNSHVHDNIIQEYDNLRIANHIMVL